MLPDLACRQSNSILFVFKHNKPKKSPAAVKRAQKAPTHAHHISHAQFHKTAQLGVKAGPGMYHLCLTGVLGDNLKLFVLLLL